MLGHLADPLHFRKKKTETRLTSLEQFSNAKVSNYGQIISATVTRNRLFIPKFQYTAGG
jgi:hypothetical protein